MSTIIRTYNKIKDKCEVLGCCLGLKAWTLEFFAKYMKSQFLQEKKHIIISKYLEENCWKENQYDAILRDVHAKCPEKINKKTIWVFWYQGFDGMPKIVKRCYRQLNRMKGASEVILLTRDNLNDYISLPQFIYDKVNRGAITLTHYSDIIRFTLLYLYGGFWVDATVWLSKPLSRDILESRYWTIRNPQPNYTISVSRYQWTTFFLYVKESKDDFPKYTLIMMLLYWEKNRKLVDYLLVDYSEEFATKYLSVKYDWEAIKQSNTKLYELIRNINNDYSMSQWEEWKKDTFAYKLSYKVKIEQKKNSYYNKIILADDRKI